MRWIDVIDIVLACLALVLLLLVGLAARRRVLAYGGGSFECSLRLSARPEPGGWALGLARYRGDELEWFRIFSPSPRPMRRFSRRDLSEVTHRRGEGGGQGTLAWYAGQVTVAVNTYDAGMIEMAMSEEALTGFLAWLEAAPPGSQAYAD